MIKAGRYWKWPAQEDNSLLERRNCEMIESTHFGECLGAL